MNTEAVRRKSGSALRATLAGLAVAGIVLVAGLAVSPAPTARADDDSAVTVTAREQDANAANAPFPDLEVTVSQTKELVDQGITITWKGGKRSTVPSSENAGTNLLQIMQCWGDDPAGGPDRTTCQYGAESSAGNSRSAARERPGDVAEQDAEYTAPPGAPYSFNSYTSIPFRPVKGEALADVEKSRYVRSVDIGNNQYFTRYTTNEVPWGGSGADGTGIARFEVQTASRAPGLGCGTPTSDAIDATGQSCWLVIVPRGTNDVGRAANVDSPLFWDNWKHRIAVKLDFRALGVRCPIGAAERQLLGSELIGEAVSSWQPSLCGTEGGSIYSLITGTESDAATQANLSGTAPLALTSRSLGDADADRLQYAPLALAGVAVSFAIDRDSGGLPVPQEAANRERTPITSIKLTPRLIAKLLTYSYVDSLPDGADKSHIGYIDRLDNPGKNARNITRDPDFLAVNDKEWEYQAMLGGAIADLLIPQGRSDAAWAVWQYVLADEDARRFLAGEADPWGMVVNPWYSTDAEKNKSENAFVIPRDTFPKADPVEFPALNGNGPVNLVTHRPYTIDLAQSALLTLRGEGQLLGSWDVNAIPPRWTRQSRALPGGQKLLGLTDTASASRYQVFTAELLNPAGEFVAPTTEGLQAAAAAMTRDSAQAQVFGFDSASPEAARATAAYPLTLPIYASARSDIADADLREDYADFIRYAVGPGQEEGEARGQLPAGYAPIPDSWREQALAAATTIATGPVPTATSSTAPAAPAGAAAPPRSAASSAGGYAGQAASAAEPVVGQPAAVGEATTLLAGPNSAPDPDLGAYGAVVPISAAAGLAAAGAALFFSRRRVV